MSFKHKLVADIAPPPPLAPCDPLQEFRQAIHRSDRKLKTTLRSQNTAWVYAEDELFVRGWVGWGDFQTSRYGQNKFVVSARGIINCKYTDHSEQYCMKMSLAMAPTLKVAKRTLTKYTPHEVEQIYRRTVRDKVHDKRERLRSQERSALSSTGIAAYGPAKEKMVRELGHLAMSGHTFTDPDFGQNVQLLLETKEALSCLPDVVPMDFVHIYPTPWETRADILAVPDALTMYGQTPQMCTWVAEELPENVMGKIAVMQMCEDEQYVDGVGLRVNESTFYLHKESDDTWK